MMDILMVALLLKLWSGQKLFADFCEKTDRDEGTIRAGGRTMLQIILVLAMFVILVIPMGRYMYYIATDQKTFADRVFIRLTA